MRISFNSLQTGKHIQSVECLTWSAPEQLGTFQFPSNGKAYPKTYRVFYFRRCRHSVSIPFKRESISKVNACKQRGNHDDQFQFPSNGKAYPKVYLRKQYVSTTKDKVSIPFKRGKHIQSSQHHGNGRGSKYRFNSLQTGKHIQSRTRFRLLESNQRQVSIPFKRESISKETPF